MEEYRYRWIDKQRRLNTIIATLHVFLLGFEFQAILVTLLYYLEKEVSVDDHHLYYGVVTASFFLSASFSGVAFGRFADRTRNVKLIILANALLSIIGNVMYTVPCNVWFLIIGRFFNGFSESIQPVMCGEFNKVYSSTEIETIISIYQIAFGVGYTIGPATSAMFSGVNITIIKDIWQITEYNTVGAFLATLNLIIALLITFCYKNSTEEEISTKINCNNDECIVCDDLEISWQKNEEEIHIQQSYKNSSEEKLSTKTYCNNNDNECISGDDLEISCQKNEEEIHIQQQLMSCSDLCDIDIISMIVCSSFTEASSSSLEIVVNMTAITTFGWSLKKISIVSTIAVVVAYIFIFIAVYKKAFEGPFRVYMSYMVCLGAQSFLLFIATIPYFATITNVWVQVLYFTTLIGITCFIYFSLMSVAKLLLFRIVPRHSSSFADGIRTGLSLALVMFSYLFSSQMYFHGNYIFPPSLILLLGFIVIFFVRRHVYYYEKVECKI